MSDLISRKLATKIQADLELWAAQKFNADLQITHLRDLDPSTIVKIVNKVFELVQPGEVEGVVIGDYTTSLSGEKQVLLHLQSEKKPADFIVDNITCHFE